ncbi:MAG: molybdopterin-binding protein [Rhodovibrionaceae bacterium]
MTASGGQATAAVLIVGNEILSGRTQDANLGYLGKRLNDCGIRLVEARVVRDVEAEVVAAVNALRARNDYLFTTGGIGPTHDDITAACIAKAFGRALIVHPEARRILLDFYGPEKLTEARLRMARTPEGASLIENAVSRAPGFRVENVFVMAGIPRVMQAMFEAVAGSLEGGRPMVSATLVARAPESTLAGPLTALQERFPGVEMGSYPFRDETGFGAELVLRGLDPQEVETAAAALRAALAAADLPVDS